MPTCNVCGKTIDNIEEFQAHVEFDHLDPRRRRGLTPLRAGIPFGKVLTTPAALFGGVVLGALAILPGLSLWRAQVDTNAIDHGSGERFLIRAFAISTWVVFVPLGSALGAFIGGRLVGKWKGRSGGPYQ